MSRSLEEQLYWQLKRQEAVEFLSEIEMSVQIAMKPLVVIEMQSW